jgi:tetratricopeptide (TPR) repeat protein
MKKTIYILITLSVISLTHFFLVKNNGISLDDNYYYSQVKEVKELSDIPLALQQKFSVVDYRPVTTFTFAIEQVLTNGQINPHLSHWFNLILYIFNCWLLYLFLAKLPLKNREKFIPIIATILFASLPLHASMVANVKSRDGLLSFLFGMIYLHGILRLFRKEESYTKKAIVSFISVLSIVLAIYSKLDAFNFLIATPFIYFLFNFKIQLKFLLRSLILTVITIRFAFFIFSFWVDTKDKAIEFSNDVEKVDPILFTENPIISHTSILAKAAYSIQTIFEYIPMVFQPKGHYYYFGYDMLPVLPINSPIIWFKAFIIFLILLSALLIYKKNRLYSFGIVFFFVSLLYCANFMTPVSGIVADRYAYIASMGACIALACILNKLAIMLLRKFRPALYDDFSKTPNIEIDFKSKSFLYFLLPVVAISLFYLPYNIHRSKDWKSLFSIFEADLPHITLKSYEANRIATKSYVETAIDTDDPKMREAYFKKGLKYGINGMNIYNDGQYVQDGVIMSLYGLNDFISAVDFSRKVIAKFDSTEIGWRMLTEFYYSSKMLDSAAIGYRKLINMVPSDPNLYFFYVSTLRENHQQDKAINFLDSLITDNPKNFLPFQAKAYMYLEDKDSANAVINIEKAMENGLRDKKLLDDAGRYWWTRDQEKWEYMKRYVPK